ncbi:putative ABC transport system permease protein [Ekhidna lutea]|uniref:Putative ABC transport system permease protein n=1 Tax=Ekhidna lutea TaxID=447679 RepID=A0A239IR72_EKHLU|nr:FtsX-like permease family protein [Ekhidna lutea]SNS95573.1 putative ABC transport system permease protein [Ekhidna lutea]
MPELQPPKWAQRFLRWYCREDYLDEIEGDLFELYSIRVAASSRKANLFFVWNVFRSFRWINLKKTQLSNNWTMNMFKNYSKIYFRRFRKETVHYAVNILGLSLGLSILFFILMFVYDEQNIDSFHSKKDRIYRVVNEVQEEEGLNHYLSGPNPLAKALKTDFPSVEETSWLTYFGSHVLAKDDIRIADRDWAIVNRGMFDILDIDILEGNPVKQTEGDAGIVITEEVAMKLFGRTDVVGEVVDGSRFGTIEVVAIMDDMPRNSSYQFKELYVLNPDQMAEGWQNFLNDWDTQFMQTWVLLKEGTTPEDVYASKDQFIEKYIAEENKGKYDFYLHPLTEVHLGSTHIKNGGPAPLLSIPYSDREFVSMILIMGMLVIFIAALNYVNLSSVQALKRTLEASMRKINGATNKHLFGQLFFETFLTVILSYVLALLLIVVLFPFFLQIANKDFGISLLFSADFIFYHVISILIIWTISALLPALYYSQLKRSLLVMKNAFSGKGDLLRKGLVGIQYALSIFLIIGSLVIYRQLNYVQSKDLGFNNKNMIVLDINSGAARGNFKNIVEGIKNNPNVINASTSSRVPGEWKDIPIANVSKNLTDDAMEFSHYAADKYWLDTYDIKLLDGENFTGADQSDSLYILINEEAVKALNLEQPIGESVWVMSNSDSVKMRIKGVVENFHFESLYEAIGPVLITHWNNHIRSIDYFTIKYAQNPKETIAHIEEVNATFDPNTPAEINFLDQQWERFYEAEESRSTIILIASIVSIIISAFGLFGLINFTVERKTKEIGIRKVMGANVQNITTLILKDYLILLIISLVIAAPVSWWLFGDWLADFAYRINMSVDLFVIAFVLVLIISFTTVLARIYKIAKANPVQSIRYE